MVMMPIHGPRIALRPMIMHRYPSTTRIAPAIPPPPVADAYVTYNFRQPNNLSGIVGGNMVSQYQLFDVTDQNSHRFG